MLKSQKSLTGKYLSGTKKIEVPLRRRKGNGKYVKIFGAEQYNLKILMSLYLLEVLLALQGFQVRGKVPWSKISFTRHWLVKIYKARVHPGKYKKIEGMENIDKVIIIDQSPIGRTSRSNPITYVGGFTPIREIFAKTKEARMRGYKLGRFSFNVKEGRCFECRGDGSIKIPMHFLEDVIVKCKSCKGQRYNQQTLEIKFKIKI